MLPNYVYPSSLQDPTSGNGAKQAWMRGYNLTNLTFTGGGVLDGGGPWWWCVRMLAAGRKTTSNQEIYDRTFLSESDCL